MMALSATLVMFTKDFLFSDVGERESLCVCVCVCVCVLFI